MATHEVSFESKFACYAYYISITDIDINALWNGTRHHVIAGPEGFAA
jgi:hypothetical protein